MLSKHTNKRALPILKIVKRIQCATLTGFVFGLLAFLYMGFMFGFDLSVTWGVLLWYTFIGFIIGIVGTLQRHPIFGFHLIFLRGMLVAGILNLGLGLIAEQEFKRMFAFIPFAIEWAFLLEGLIVGAIIDGVATRVGGEGKGLLQRKS